MFPIMIRPDKAAEELVQFNQKLTEGLKNLNALESIEEGVSAKEVVYQEDKLVLYRFKSLVDNPHRVPVLIVYALVNRPYMTDIQEDRSMVRGLLEQGMDVYLIDWGYPDAADRFLGLDDYINGYINNCVEFICNEHSLHRINVLGICQGGSMSITYTALHPDKVRNLVTMVTPVDFHAPGNLLSAWIQNIDVDLLVDTLGNIPGELLNLTFLSLQPYRLTGQKYLDLVELMGDPVKLKNFMRMEKWIFDSPDQAGEAFREFMKKYYQANGFVNGNLNIGGEQVDLKNITMPVFNVYATYDHLVPTCASEKLKELVGSDDYSEFSFKGGHIGIYVSGRSQREVPPAIATWLKERG